MVIRAEGRDDGVEPTGLDRGDEELEPDGESRWNVREAQVVRKCVQGLINAGLTPIPFFEGDYTPRLKYLQELPPGQVLGHFDKIDRRKAKEFLGDIMCFWGNVPTSLLCCGTPQQVKSDVRELIEIFGDTGGLIIDGSVGIPDEAKPENLHALTEAVHEMGTC